MIYDNFDENKFNNVNSTVDTYYNIINDIVNKIIDPYVKDLDDFSTSIKNGLEDKEHPVTTEELTTICMKLSTYIYFASGATEQLGIKDDISKAIYKEVYNNKRTSLEKGTVADKNVEAELESQHEQLTNICFSRAYKIVKSKVEAATDLLSSCKKVLTYRISEMSLSNMDLNK